MALSRISPTPLTANPPVDVTKAAAVVGVGTAAARDDHKHDVSTAVVVEITDATNAEGVATSLARSDHMHSHGGRGGGTLHAVATGAVAGFMSAADKTKMDRRERALFMENPVTSDVDPTFFTPVAIVLTEMRAIIRGGTTPSVAWTIRFGPDRSAAGTEVVTGGSTCTNKTTGQVVTVFTVGTIPAGSFAWLALGAVTTGVNAPSAFTVTLS